MRRFPEYQRIRVPRRAHRADAPAYPLMVGPALVTAIRSRTR
jgi:hypothetical protein